jgi:hypothetical protein
VGECVVPERSTYEDRLMKRHNIESRVSSGDTSSSGSRGPEDEVKPLGCCGVSTNLEEDEAHSRGKR